jgi:hypothetical protein
MHQSTPIDNKDDALSYILFIGRQEISCILLHDISHNDIMELMPTATETSPRRLNVKSFSPSPPDSSRHGIMQQVERAAADRSASVPASLTAHRCDPRWLDRNR